MKFLIDQYHSQMNTEYLYLSREFEKNEEMCYIRGHSQNIFDVFGKFNPDVYITSSLILSKESLECVKKFDTTMFLSLNDITRQQYAVIESAMKEREVKCKAYLKVPTINFRNLNKKNSLIFPPAIDPEINSHINGLNFYIQGEVLIICESSNFHTKLVKSIPMYHSMSVKSGMSCDINASNIVEALRVIHNYKKIVFCSETISQLFLECFIRHDNVMISYSSERDKEVLEDILKKHFYINENIFYEDGHTEMEKESRDRIVEVIKDKHTAENRYKRIMSQLQ